MLHCLTFFSRGRCSIATTLHPPGWLVQWVLTKAWDDAKATNDPSIQRLKDPTTHRFQAFQRKSFDSWRWCSRWRSKLLDEFESLTVTQGCIVCDLRLFRWFGCLSHVSCLRTDTRMLQLCVWSSSWLSLPTIPSILFWSRPRGLKRSKSSPQLFCFIRFSWSPRSPLSSLSLCFFFFLIFSISCLDTYIQDNKLIGSDYYDYLIKLTHISQSCQLQLREEGADHKGSILK